MVVKRFYYAYGAERVSHIVGWLCRIVAKAREIFIYARTNIRYYVNILRWLINIRV